MRVVGRRVASWFALCVLGVLAAQCGSEDCSAPDCSDHLDISFQADSGLVHGSYALALTTGASAETRCTFVFAGAEGTPGLCSDNRFLSAGPEGFVTRLPGTPDSIRITLSRSGPDSMSLDTLVAPTYSEYRLSGCGPACREATVVIAID